MTHPQQETVPLGVLRGAEYNPRRMPEATMRALVRSLAEFGFVQPLVVRRSDNLVVGGHQRAAAYRLLLTERGLPPAEVDAAEVPVVYVDLDEARTRLLNVALNKISGEWDFAKLGELLAGLGDAPVELTGFSADEVSDILAVAAGAPVDVAAAAGGGLSDAEVDAGLAQYARRFVFTLETDEAAKACDAVLREYGMTGPGNAAEAFYRMVQAAAGRAGALPALAGKKKGRKKRANDGDAQAGG